MSLLDILSTLILGPLKLIFEIIFVYAHKATRDPGAAIVILSLIMNFLVLPLYKRADAMQEAARDVEAKLQEGVSHIKRVYSGDERMMILQTYYRQNNYKPTDALNGSVSLLLEVPFFMAAYQFLSSLQLLEGASLGPIADLGAPDGLIRIGGIAINALPVIMTLVNVISSAIYLKGFPLKTKIQLYAMAAFFLVFLYTSPSGLVFYWTLNNLFSLAKTIFYKLKNPKKTAVIGASVIGLVIAGYALFIYSGRIWKLKMLLVAMGALLQVPVLVVAVKNKLHFRTRPAAGKHNWRVFALGALLLTILTGVLIPSAYIAASPQEFVDLTFYQNPLWYCVSSACLAAGTFFVWMGVFYWLANDAGKAIFDKLVWILCGTMIVNYMFFGTELGVIRADLRYEVAVQFTKSEQLTNLLVLIAVAAGMYLFAAKWGKRIPVVLLTAAITMGSMSAINVVKINGVLKDMENLSNMQSAAAPQFELSTEGKNVVVIMLDRAMCAYIPHMFHEDPGLQEQFDGFTNYTNTISFGSCTNFATPALFGGYEYTPVEMNKRSAEPLASKQNEALKLMPVLFSENGYQVTVCDPVYANYSWLPDLSIYDDYPEINAYAVAGKFGEPEQKEAIIRNNHRNFFCLSIMKTLPVALQPQVYNGGNYNQIGGSPYGGQTVYGMSSSEGLSSAFMEAFSVLQNLTEMTRITEGDSNTFMSLVNNSTHEPMLLQAPDYLPAVSVDNTAYDGIHEDRFTVGGKTLKVNGAEEMQFYHVHMAAFKQLGNWFDYLREHDVYDNTRIILVSDHGWTSDHYDQLYISGEDGEMHNAEAYHPLLMVKDFNSTGFVESDTFMTNADVPTLAMAQLIENPVNPFTGKPVTDDEKYAHDQVIIVSPEFDVLTNNGNTFLPAQWGSVKENIWQKENWLFTSQKRVLAEHALQ